VTINRLEDPGALWGNPLKAQLEAYLQSLGPDAPVKPHQEILDSEKYHPANETRLREAAAVAIPPADECRETEANAARLRETVRTALAEHRLDAVAYPSWSNPRRRLSDLTSSHGNNSPRLSPPTGFPAVTVSMGFVADGLPAGLQFLSNVFSEATLFRLAYGYERATEHQRPPTSRSPLY
jgi:amidase